MPASCGRELSARLKSVDTSKSRPCPAIKVVHDGNYLAVVAEQEYQAVAALNALSACAE